VLKLVRQWPEADHRTRADTDGILDIRVSLHLILDINFIETMVLDENRSIEYFVPRILFSRDIISF
jgi:hypothetical protein